MSHRVDPGSWRGVPVGEAVADIDAGQPVTLDLGLGLVAPTVWEPKTEPVPPEIVARQRRFYAELMASQRDRR